MFSIAAQRLWSLCQVAVKSCLAGNNNAKDALLGLARGQGDRSPEEEHHEYPDHNQEHNIKYLQAGPTPCEEFSRRTVAISIVQASDPDHLPPPPTQPPGVVETMAEAELRNVSRQLQQALHSHNHQQCQQLLSRAKMALLQLNALIPSPQTPANHLLAARELLELGAIASIRMNNEQSPDSFTRYFQQLQPFYALPASQLPTEHSQQSRVTGLYLLLLLSTGDYGGFHTMLETLEMAKTSAGSKRLEDDEFIQYPMRLEQALMEGSYDRVWQETKGSNVPGEEYGIFSGFLINTIRDEIASCSEKAYASVPISNAKNLFFLESEGAVVQFAQSRGWITKDARIYFPQQDQDLLASEKDILSASDQVIENTLGYARELETIV